MQKLKINCEIQLTAKVKLTSEEMASLMLDLEQHLNEVNEKMKLSDKDDELYLRFHFNDIATSDSSLLAERASD